MRRSARWLAVAAISLGLAGITVPLVWQQGSPDTAGVMVTTRYTDSPERRQYQDALDKSPNRFEPYSELVVEDGLLWFRADYNDRPVPCDAGCATIENEVVILPVGYTNSAAEDSRVSNLESIRSLTYWNPILHAQETIHRLVGQASVKLPDFLLSGRNVASLKVGESGYVPTVSVRHSPQGAVYLFNGVDIIDYEPLHGYGHRSEQAMVTKLNDNDVCVRMPANTAMLVVEDVNVNPQWWLPITIC